MVQCQISPTDTAIHTHVAVADKHFFSTQSRLRSRSLDEVDKSYDRWRAKIVRGRSKNVSAVLQYLGFSSVYENERTSLIADVERFVVLI